MGTEQPFAVPTRVRTAAIDGRVACWLRALPWEHPETPGFACAAYDAGPRAAGTARDLTREALKCWGLLDRLDEALVVVSELVTNAVVHGTTTPTGTVTVALARAGDILAVVVEDESPDLPVQRSASAGAVSGRGLALVDELCAYWTALRRSGRLGKWTCAFLTPPGSGEDDHPHDLVTAGQPVADLLTAV